MARVVQTLDSAIQRTNIGETNCAIQWIVIYPVDSVIHLLKQLGPVRLLDEVFVISGIIKVEVKEKVIRGAVGRG